ncbi:MAG: hypothetical protein ACR2LI_05900 [Propionibacteriaceae bacterium]
MTQTPSDERPTGSGYVADVDAADATEVAWPPRRSAPDDTVADYDTATTYSTDQGATAVGDAGFTATGSDDAGSSKTGDVAKHEAAQVKNTAVDAGTQVGDVAKDEAQNVVGEAKEQALGLLDQAKSEAGSQAVTQQQRVAGLLGGYASELQSMTSGQESSGPITDLARQGADKASELTSWLENHEPADILDELGAFARRRPVAFLVGAALAGVVVGRATRGFASNAKAEKMPSSPATPVRGELSGTPRSVVEEVPTQADAFGSGADLAAPYGSADPVVSPAFDDQRRDDVVR